MGTEIGKRGVRELPGEETLAEVWNYFLFVRLVVEGVIFSFGSFYPSFYSVYSFYSFFLFLYCLALRSSSTAAEAWGYRLVLQICYC